MQTPAEPHRPYSETLKLGIADIEQQLGARTHERDNAAAQVQALDAAVSGLRANLHAMRAQLQAASQAEQVLASMVVPQMNRNTELVEKFTEELRSQNSNSPPPPATPTQPRRQRNGRTPGRKKAGQGRARKEKSDSPRFTKAGKRVGRPPRRREGDGHSLTPNEAAMASVANLGPKAQAGGEA